MLSSNHISEHIKETTSKAIEKKNHYRQSQNKGVYKYNIQIVWSSQKNSVNKKSRK